MICFLRLFTFVVSLLDKLLHYSRLWRYLVGFLPCDQPSLPVVKQVYCGKIGGFLVIRCYGMT